MVSVRKIVMAAALGLAAAPLAAVAQDKPLPPPATDVPDTAQSGCDKNAIVCPTDSPYWWMYRYPRQYAVSPVTTLSAEDLDEAAEDNRPGMIDLIGKLFRRKH